jgi:hypothetical protein
MANEAQLKQDLEEAKEKAARAPQINTNAA